MTPWLLVIGLFFPLRQLEQWLHQHFFKVGWLLTLNIYRIAWQSQGQGEAFALDESQNQRCLQSTTILYYTFFLPGVVLHEFVYWFTAGVLNVRADRSIKWPEAKAIGELELNFVTLDKKAGDLRRAIIATMPLIVGITIIWIVANNILNVGGFVTALQNSSLEDIPAAFNQLTSSTPDFWLWVYLLFTISNTMMPDFNELKGWRIVGVIVAIITVALFLLGAGDEVANVLISGPITSGLSILAGTFATVIVLDLFMVGVLGTVEAIIERITGDSATFKNGKMITLRREELLKQRAEEREKQAKRAERDKKRQIAAETGPPSIYKLPLPIPQYKASALAAPTPAPATEAPATPRGEPTIISGRLAQPAAVPATEEENAPREETDEAAPDTPDEAENRETGEPTDDVPEDNADSDDEPERESTA